MFNLDPRLEQDSMVVGDFELCNVRLMNDARYPWIILIPRRNNISEIYQLTEQEQSQLNRESTFVTQKLAQFVSADKMNVAALGNVVNQLHIHYVARFRNDESWPDPIWGKGQALPYSQQESEVMINHLKTELVEFL